VQNGDVLQVVQEAISLAQATSGKSDAEKREVALNWAKKELYKLLGQYLPDSAVNFLIETVMVQIKGREGKL
jgi:hypothetical protein